MAGFVSLSGTTHLACMAFAALARACYFSEICTVCGRAPGARGNTRTDGTSCCHRDVRTSQGTFMSRHDDPSGVISWIEEKAALVTGLPVDHGEVHHLQQSIRHNHYIQPARVSSLHGLTALSHNVIQGLGLQEPVKKPW